MYILEVEPMDLGPEVRAISLELAESEEDSRAPVRGQVAGRIWASVLGAMAGDAPWALDFFSHIERVREYCGRHGIAHREATSRSVVIAPPAAPALADLLSRFEAETFGVRAGGPLPSSDAALESELARCGADAYQNAYRGYLFCGICSFEEGSLVALSERLWASEILRRIRPVSGEFQLDLRLPA